MSGQIHTEILYNSGPDRILGPNFCRVSKLKSWRFLNRFLKGKEYSYLRIYFYYQGF